MGLSEPNNTLDTQYENVAIKRRYIYVTSKGGKIRFNRNEERNFLPGIYIIDSETVNEIEAEIGTYTAEQSDVYVEQQLTTGLTKRSVVRWSATVTGVEFRNWYDMGIDPGLWRIKLVTAQPQPIVTEYMLTLNGVVLLDGVNKLSRMALDMPVEVPLTQDAAIEVVSNGGSTAFCVVAEKMAQ